MTSGTRINNPNLIIS